MLKELMPPFGIGSAKLNLKTVQNRSEISGDLNNITKIKVGGVRKVMEEVYDSLVKMSDNLKFLAG